MKLKDILMELKVGSLQHPKAKDDYGIVKPNSSPFTTKKFKGSFAYYLQYAISKEIGNTNFDFVDKDSRIVFKYKGKQYPINHNPDTGSIDDILKQIKHGIS